MIDKQHLLGQLRDHLREIARLAQVASEAAAEEARSGATAGEKRTDARVAIENAGLAQGQQRRAVRATRELEALEHFDAPDMAQTDRVAVGAIVEVEDEDTGEGRTLFLAPVGAGVTVTGPGGDGLFAVITPASPMGRAVIGKRIGDQIEVNVRGECRDCVISWVA